MSITFEDNGETVARWATNRKALFVDQFLYGHLIKCPSCDEMGHLNEDTNVFTCESCGYEENRA